APRPCLGCPDILRAHKIMETTRSGRAPLKLDRRPLHAPNIMPAPPRSSGASLHDRCDRNRSMPDHAAHPHHPWGCWIFARRAVRSRSNNLVISTTEQRAALPYQGRGTSAASQRVGGLSYHTTNPGRRVTGLSERRTGHPPPAIEINSGIERDRAPTCTLPYTQDRMMSRSTVRISIVRRRQRISSTVAIGGTGPQQL